MNSKHKNTDNKGFRECLHLVNAFPHVHSFRLSDKEEKVYKALMSRFHISSSNQSVAFRKLLGELQSFFSEMDDDEQTLSQPLSGTQSEEEELSPYSIEPGEDQGDESDYAEYRQEAVHRIIMRGQQPLTYENILAEVRAIKKKASGSHSS